LVSFPNAKINLGLHIIGRRADGFHDLETVFCPVPLHDALEIVQLTKPGENPQFSSTGIEITGADSDNLCVRAYLLLKKNFPGLPSVQMHLHKTIPLGAGLGGGSADAAFTLLLLNRKFNLDLQQQQLRDYALQLGSDCPFFIVNKPCFASGRGELLQEIELELSGYKIVLINPSIHINTGWAFSKIEPLAGRPSVADLIRLPAAQWKENLKNDFEVPVFEAYPELKEIRDKLYQAGAVYTSMSGSGSTIYGIFPSTPKLPEFPVHYFIKLL